ncbi:DUF3999 family protein [Cesiribacter sp. SM1]|uniref:DUF3999 family protein n=1 Tax=Cesiribacter sp. SM1 TaxID=2861196 RepID=UPI001CD5EE20|nr:DUF3999 family protein [Cesiribacter sp. SM1]
MNKSTPLLLLLLMCSTFCFAQWQGYQYQRKLEGVSSSWHSVPLPDDIFSKLNPDLSDLRVRGIAAGGDTLEMPYLLQNTASKTVVRQLPFQLLNQTSKAGNYFYTMELPEEKALNEIQLQFGNPNFDWRVKLEGSHSQGEWFTVLDNYRILSVENAYTDYSFTTLRFPTIRYKYLRLQISSDKKPELMPLTLLLKEAGSGEYRNYTLSLYKAQENRKEKQTEILLELPQPLPLSQMLIQVADTFDYYRPISLQYAIDSSKIENGWRYHYRTLFTGTLSSLEDSLFTFNNTIARKLRLLIHNGSNLPLNIRSVQLQGPRYLLITRLDTGNISADSSTAAVSDQYYLVYGNPEASAPRYDIALFPDRIPLLPEPVALGPEDALAKNLPATSSLFVNKLWLWSIMLLLIGIMGWFAIKMLRTENQSQNA